MSETLYNAFSENGDLSIEVFANNLDRLMASKGVSDAELGRAIGVTRRHVRHWLDKERLPSFTDAEKVAAHIECKITDLITPPVETLYNAFSEKGEISIEMFAKNLDRLMTTYGVSNADLGRAIGVSRQNVHQWLHKDRLPTFTHAKKIASHMGCKITDLMTSPIAASLNRTMAHHDISPHTLSQSLGVSTERVEEWLAGEGVPDEPQLLEICRYLNERYAINYTVEEFTGTVTVIPLRVWARGKGIPLKRAEDMVRMKILTNVLHNRKFGTLIPRATEVPTDSKRKVFMAKRRPTWGIKGLENFHIRLNDLMIERDMGNETLAEIVGVNKTTISHWRSGIRTPKEDNMRDIARAFRCSVKSLVASFEDDLV